MYGTLVEPHALSSYLKMYEEPARSIGYIKKNYVSSPSGYETPKTMGCYMANMADCLADKFTGPASPGPESNTELAPHVTSLHGMVKYDNPYFWVSREMLQAVMETNFSEEMSSYDLNWPFKTIAFNLPVGMIEDEEGDSIALLILNLKEPEETCYLPGFENLVGSYNHNDHPVVQLSAFPSANKAYTFWSSMDATKPLSYMFSDANPDRNKKESEFVGKLMSIGLQLLAIMSACPEYVGECKPVKRAKSKINGKKVMNTLHSIRWVGEHYKQAVSHSSTHQGGTVKSHWRRGHTRQQACGPNMSERKIIWVKPTLINP